MKTLNNMLAPQGAAAFLEEYWTKKVLLQRGHPAKYTELFSWDQYNNLLDEQLYHLSFPDIRLVNQGRLIPEHEMVEYLPSRRVGAVKRISSQMVNTHCKRGATLVLDAVNKINTGLAAFANELSAIFGDKVQINSYCSWKGTQAFDIHFDVQDAFILQIEGSKDWAVYEQLGTDYPVVNRHDKAIPREVEPSIKCTLKKGDLLYIPRGVWHSAISRDEPSLHLTVGVYCKTKMDFVQWVVKSLLENNQAFRQNLRAMSGEKAANGYEGEHLQGVFNNFKQMISDKESIADLAHRYHLQELSKDNIIKQFSFPHSVVEDPIGDPDTRFYRIPSQKAVVSPLEKEEGMKVLYGGKVLVFRGEVDKVVNGIFSRESFSGADVLTYDEDFEWEDIKPLLSQLVKAQVIYVKTGARQKIQEV